MWNIINTRKCKTSKPKCGQIELKIDDKIVDDPQTIANAFSMHFENSVDDIKIKLNSAATENIK